MNPSPGWGSVEAMCQNQGLGHELCLASYLAQSGTGFSRPVLSSYRPRIQACKLLVQALQDSRRL